MTTFENKVSGDKEPAIVGISEKYTGVWGETHGGASGVYGKSGTWHGVFGESDSNTGVVGTSNSLFGVHGASKSSTGSLGESDTGFGVHGASKSSTGVVGVSQAGYGVTGEGGGTFAGVRGGARQGRGVEGWSTSNSGVWGISESGIGVEGSCKPGDGVVGTGRRGVVGLSETFQGVYGWSGDNAGVVGESERMHAVFAISHSPTLAALYAKNTNGADAGLFDGNVTVTGDLILAGADVAEEFPTAAGTQDLEPGSVVVLDAAGHLMTSSQPYDSRVAGVISGGGDRVPALVLDRRSEPPMPGAQEVRRPVAVTGKAWCFADATEHPIQVGDLLTTAPQPGHAMRVSDRLQAIGAVIGKALTPLTNGTGQVLVLVGLS